MAEMTIRLMPDPSTGKKNIIISLRSDDDALPHEHEQQHRALVDKLINGGLLKAEELGTVTVTREEEAKQPAPQRQPETQQRKAQQAGGGS
jgi:hypothetical protein